MKNKYLGYIILFILPLIASLTAYSQQSVWSSKLNAMKVFIENKGQFSKDLPEENVTLYSYIGSKEKFYFSKSGVTIKIDQYSKKKKPASIIGRIFGNKKEMEENEEFKIRSYYLFAKWENPSAQLIIEPIDQSEGYYTFGQEKIMANGYKKLLYKNIYPGIDVEYIIPGDSSGIEYNLIVHPGADISQARLTYSGDINEMTLDAKGNIVIETPAGPITEHYPVSRYAFNNNVLNSGFSLQKKSISFKFPDGYDTNETVIVDPWVTGINITGSDIAWNVDYDNNNHLYAYIRTGLGGIYVNKYSDTGALLWSHAVTSSTQYEGDFLVDRSMELVYIGEGFNGGGAYIYRLNSAGTADGWVSQVNTSYVEIWEMAFARNGSSLIAIGGGTASNLNGGIVDLGSGAIDLANFSGFGGICQDIVSGVVDNFTQLFVIYAQTICGVAGQIDNKIELVNDSLNGPVWIAPSGFNAFLESSNHVPPIGAQSCNGFNALAVNDHFLFYYDGGGLAAYRKSNGAMLSSVSVGLTGTYYTTLNQAGIVADDCDHVFVGGPDNQVKYYSFNGTTFTYIDSIQLGWTGTGVSVRDIKFRKENKLLFVGGLNNVGVYDDPITCTVSVDENNLSNENLKIFPNPANDYTTVKINEPGKHILEIIDVTGKVIETFEMQNEIKIYTGDLKRGTYLVRIGGDKNKVAKLIVQ